MSVFADNLTAKKKKHNIPKREPKNAEGLHVTRLRGLIRGATGTHQPVGFERLILTVKFVPSFLFHPMRSIDFLTFINPSFPIFCA